MYLVDSNVFLHVALHTSEAEHSKRFLDKNKGEISTTLYNLMEIGSVLSRKYHWKRTEITNILSFLKKSVSIYVPDEYDAMNSYELAIEHFLTPIDALLISIADREELTFITYDKELLSLNKSDCKIISPVDVK